MPTISAGTSQSIGELQAAAQGLLSQNFDRSAASNNQLMTGGTAYAVLVPVRQGWTVGNVYCNVQAAGSGVTMFKAGIYSLDGATKYAQTADQSSSFGSTGVKTLPLSASWTVPSGVSACFIVFVATASTTLPTLFRGLAASQVTAIGSNAQPFALSGTGLSDLPTVTVTFSSINGVAMWAGIGA